MAKKNEEAVGENTEQQLPATQQQGFALSADFMADLGDLGDLGYSEKAEDSMIPILAILQDNSGEVKARHSKRIEGASAGDLIIRSIQKVIPMGPQDAPLVFQPCAFQHVWVEWEGETGEGVPVGQFAFDAMPDDAIEKLDPQDPEGKKKMWVRANGNRLVDTRYHFGHVIGDDGSLMPLVVPMAGTNHTVSRQWTATMKQFSIPGAPGRRAPAFMRQYALKTKFRERGSQSWYNYGVTDLGWISDENILRQGLEMLRSVTENKVAADISGMGEAASTDDGTGTDDEPI